MESTRIVESQRKAGLKNEELELFKQSFVIVPYQVSGFIDYTNRGASSDNINPDDFETFKRVWTGNDSCSIVWKNSFSLIQNNETKQLEQDWKLGEVFLGVLEINSEENKINQDVSFSEYKSQEVETRLTFRVHKYFEITPYYHLMFYKIPEISKSTLYRIESIEKDYAGRELLGYVITFKSINQELANTGRAKQQNIMPCAPGQGYLECIVEDSTWPERIGKEVFDKLISGKDYYVFFDRYITTNFQKQLNDPVKKVVVKAFGNGVINSFAMTGRTATYNSKEFGAMRKLFCTNFSSPSTPTLYRSQSSVQNYYVSKFGATLQYYKEFFTYLKDTISNINKFNYQGWLTYLDSITSTNNGEGFYSDWYFNIGEQKTTNLYTYGVESTYTTQALRNVDNFFFDNYWTTKNIKIAPLNTMNTLNYGTTIFGGLALTTVSAFSGRLLGFASGLLLSIVGLFGLSRTLQQQSKFDGINGIIPKDIIDFNSGLYSNSERIPFNVIDNNSESKDTGSEVFFKSNTINMCFEAEITDTFTTTRTGDKKINTLNIGQRTFENGENILPSGDTFLLNGDATLAKTSADGFVIDNFQFCGFFNGDISVEFLNSNGDIVWSGIYQSEAKWTDNQREIWTEKNVSIFGRENIYLSEPVPYPKPLEVEWSDGEASIDTITQLVGGSYYKNNSGGNWNLKDWSFTQYSTWGKNQLYDNRYYRYCFKQFSTTPNTFIKPTNLTFENIKNKYQRVKFSIIQKVLLTKAKLDDTNKSYSINTEKEIWSQNYNISEIKLNEKYVFEINPSNFSKKMQEIPYGSMKAEVWNTLPYTYLDCTFKQDGEDNFVSLIFNGDITKQNSDLATGLRTYTLFGVMTSLASLPPDVFQTRLAPGGEVDTRMYFKIEFIE